MDDFFYQLGRSTGRGLRRGRWLLNSLAGPSSDAIAAEYKAGCDLARSHDAGVTFDEESTSAALVAQITKRLGARLRNKERRWRVMTIRDSEPGAFALPGGFLYLTSGLLELCSADEAEIAWVVGHEMGHVVHGHAAARLAGELIGSARAYSRDQELEADEFGVKLANAAGFDAEAALRVCTRLERIEARSEQPLAEYFATHPPLAMRAERLSAWLAVQRQTESQH
ncbi:MAG: M48 family metallopeptidase [Deltaproteobacteria bacterium]|nr:M48 family metallopeptidase [Deltaproteobacteria bacterium]